MMTQTATCLTRLSRPGGSGVGARVQGGLAQCHAPWKVGLQVVARSARRPGEQVWVVGDVGHADTGLEE